MLGHPQATPQAPQGPHRQHVAQHLLAPGIFLLVKDTTELIWPEAAARRLAPGPVGPGKATSQGVRLHSLVAAAWPAQYPDPADKRPALPLLGLPDQQYHVRQPGPSPVRAALPWPCAGGPAGRHGRLFYR